ncbi:hypothetical protein [Peptostreptococcus faecalis]|uniref:hypothetical protein n=1 Tax=Peptostreptococcus faecalis TaxID=2045015 RepID=UPI000C7C3759|nr:hypothetical protein [Peptostreptococcus faecalis]
MKLYKNVDIKDLNSILKDGILPISRCGNDSWDYNKRAKNSKEVVYLFNPKTELNTFTQYGIVLLEIDVTDATLNNLSDLDYNKGKYDEYIIDEVRPHQIKKVIIPSILKDRIKKYNITVDIVYCDMHFQIYDSFKNDREIYIDAPKELYQQFVETTPIECTEFNYLRISNNDNTVTDLYNIRYIY